MGGAACKEIINRVGETEAILDEFHEKNSVVSMARLKAYVNEARHSVIYTSLYFLIEGDEDIPSQENTNPILEVLNRIITRLPFLEGNDAKTFVDKSSKELRNALDNLEKVFNQ